MSDYWKDYVAPVGSGALLAGSAVWRFFVSRRVRADKLEDDEKTRLVRELETVRRERDVLATKAEEMTARWIREVQLGAERAMQPRPPVVPPSLPPPKFKEPAPIQEIRQNVETKTLRRIRRGEPDPNSEDTIADFDVEAALAPVAPEPVVPQPYRARQISVVEVDGRKKR